MEFKKKKLFHLIFKAAWICIWWSLSWQALIKPILNIVQYYRLHLCCAQQLLKNMHCSMIALPLLPSIHITSNLHQGRVNVSVSVTGAYAHGPAELVGSPINLWSVDRLRPRFSPARLPYSTSHCEGTNRLPISEPAVKGTAVTLKLMRVDEMVLPYPCSVAQCWVYGFTTSLLVLHDQKACGFVQWSAFRPAKRLCKTSVSYTHLTLPTNHRV